MAKTDLAVAGPELNAQVAVEVMGWPRRDADMGILHWHLPNGEMRLAHDWSPSTDWAAAGEVLEHTKLLEKNRLWKKSGVWKVGSTYEYEDYLVASAATAPLAISLAALKAVRKEQ